VFNLIMAHQRSMNAARIRKAKGLNQEQLAELAGLTQPTVSRAERGDDGCTLGNYKAIAAALNVRLADLFADDRAATEQVILQTFRRLSPERQKGWVEMAQAAIGALDPEDSRIDPVDLQSSSRAKP
jgi:transcriptional regulator with XRE-family HTH domain